MTEHTPEPAHRKEVLHWLSEIDEDLKTLDGYIKSDKLTVQHLAERAAKDEDNLLAENQHRVDLSNEVNELQERVAQLERRLAGPLEGPGFGQLEQRIADLEEALSKLHDIDDQPIFEPRGPHD